MTIEYDVLVYVDDGDKITYNGHIIRSVELADPTSCFINSAVTSVYWLGRTRPRCSLFAVNLPAHNFHQSYRTDYVHSPSKLRQR